MTTIDLTNLSKDVDFIIVTLGDKNIKIPNFMSMSSVIKYEEEYEKTKDARVSFCRLLSEIAKYYDDQKEDIDFIKLKDEELIDIMKFILEDDDYYGVYLKENNYEYTFDNFYKTYDFKMKEMTNKFRKTLEPLTEFNTNLVGFFNNMQKIKIPPLVGISHLYKDFNFTPMTSYDSISSNFIRNFTEEKNVEEILDNKPIQESVNYFEDGIIILQEQLAIMKEDKETKEKSENDSLKRDKVNFWIATISLIIALLSFIGLDNMIALIKSK